MSLVLDGSLALAWCFEDESGEAVDEVMAQVASQGAIVPAIWRLEVANGLQSALRRRRLNVPKRDAILQTLADLPVAVDGETDRHAWSATLKLADSHGLTTYDASYLELANRTGLALASLDKQLRDAARICGLAVLGH